VSPATSTATPPTVGGLSVACLVVSTMVVTVLALARLGLSRLGTLLGLRLCRTLRCGLALVVILAIATLVVVTSVRCIGAAAAAATAATSTIAGLVTAGIRRASTSGGVAGGVAAAWSRAGIWIAALRTWSRGGLFFHLRLWAGFFDALERSQECLITHERDIFAVGVHCFAHQVSGDIADDNGSFSRELFDVVEFFTHASFDDDVGIHRDFRRDDKFHTAHQLSPRHIRAGVVVHARGIHGIDTDV